MSNLYEGLGYKDLSGMMKSTIHIDEFSSKMGDDDEIVVVEGGGTIGIHVTHHTV